MESRNCFSLKLQMNFCRSHKKLVSSWLHFLMATTVVSTMVSTVLSQQILLLKGGLILERERKWWVIMQFFAHILLNYMLGSLRLVWDNSKSCYCALHKILKMELGWFHVVFLYTGIYLTPERLIWRGRERLEMASVKLNMGVVQFTRMEYDLTTRQQYGSYHPYERLKRKPIRWRSVTG